MKQIRCAIIGLGNCASSFIQGLEFYKNGKDQGGLINDLIGPYALNDIEIVHAIDVDARKVGMDINEAIFSDPNNTFLFQENMPNSGVTVAMGRILDGVAPHMLTAGDRGFQLSSGAEATAEEIVAGIKKSNANILINFLPVGSQEATEFYMECALQAGVAVVNCIPVFIASDPVWADRFRARGLPLVGDDIKAQIGATIVHRTLSELFSSRGVAIKRTYQLNTGGNTDFMNMLDRSRLQNKKLSKTESVQSALKERLAVENISIGPAEYVPWQKDNKLCFLRIEGEHWGGSVVNMEIRLSVEDSPNSAACVADAVRCAKLALDRGEGGPLIVPSACYCKHPPQQIEDHAAALMLQDYITAQTIAAE
jgi:myo-inositol-1-phosphate synthase